MRSGAVPEGGGGLGQGHPAGHHRGVGQDHHQVNTDVYHPYKLLNTRTQCQHSRRLPGHDNDFADTDIKLFRLFVDFKGIIRQKTTCTCLHIQ